MTRWILAYIRILCFLVLSSCASKGFLSVPDEDFSGREEDEYFSAIQIETIPGQVLEEKVKPVAESSARKKTSVAKKKSSLINPSDKKNSGSEVKKSPIKPELKKIPKRIKRKLPLKPPKKLIPKKLDVKQKKKTGDKTASKIKRKLPLIEDDEGFDGRRPKIDPFKVGEKTVMEVRYFGVKAGELGLEVLPFVKVNDRKSYHFRTSVKSDSMFAMVYEVDDWAETFVDFDSLLPFNYSVHVKETNQNRKIRSVFDHTQNNAKLWESKYTEDDGLKKRKKEWDFTPFSQNVISVFFYIRNFQLTPGKTIKFPLSDEGNNLILEAEVLRTEKIETDIGVLDTVVVKPKVSIKGIFKPVGDVFIWFTNDERKRIVKMTSKLNFGTLKFTVKSL
ncbi:MAG: DUF3108 domain-containing protein [Bdellovibrionales bacterium]